MNNIDENYEIWLLRYADGTLSPQEKKEVEQWFSLHPEAAEELRLFVEAPKLKADEEIKYYDKESLQHIIVPVWKRIGSIAIAASISLLLMIPVMHNDEMMVNKRNVNEVAKVASKEIKEIKEIEEIVKNIPTKKTKRIEKIREFESINDADIAENIEEEEKNEDYENIDEVEQNHFALEEEIVYCDNLISISMDDEILYSYNLIAVEESTPTWANKLYALNNRAKDMMENNIIGKYIASRMPDNETLANNVVEPIESIKIPAWMQNTIEQINEFNNNYHISL